MFIVIRFPIAIAASLATASQTITRTRKLPAFIR
jgi:hypothetical protein